MAYDTLGIDLSRSYGFGFDDYDVKRLPELPDEYKSIWYSKYYYAGRPELEEEKRRLFAAGNPMDPAFATLPGSYDKLAQLEDIPGDLGYCLLDNGVGYGSTHTVMTGIDLEMYDWYKRLRMIDKLSYMIWYPGSHESELNGITVEDIGFGMSHFDALSRLDPEMLGFTVNPSEMDPKYTCIIGANTVIRNQEYPKIRPIATALFHYVRTLDSGSLDFRTHFFIGGMVLDGRLVRLQKIEPAVCLEITRQLCSHCCYERGNVKNFLPELYARKDEFDLSATVGKTGDMAIIK